MNKVAIVTDSTAYFSEKEIEELGIYVLPLSVSFGNDSYLEGINISEEDFFLRVRESERLPKSSQPSIGVFYELYQELSKSFNAIISIHLSSGISGTFQTVHSIAKQNSNFNIYPFDSTVTSEIQADLVREAVKMSRERKSAEEIVERLAFMLPHSDVFFAVDDLTNLIKGGRVPKQIGNAANFLNVKPVLTFKNGEIVSYSNVRTRKRVIKEIKGLFTKAISNSQYPLKASIVHVYDEEAGRVLLNEFQEEFPDVQFNFSFLGPVIGTHVGEKTFGITWTVDFDKINK